MSCTPQSTFMNDAGPTVTEVCDDGMGEYTAARFMTPTEIIAMRGRWNDFLAQARHWQSFLDDPTMSALDRETSLIQLPRIAQNMKDWLFLWGRAMGFNWAAGGDLERIVYDAIRVQPEGPGRGPVDGPVDMPGTQGSATPLAIIAVGVALVVGAVAVSRKAR